MRRTGPALLATLVAGAYVIWRLAIFEGDPVGLFELGTQFSAGDTAGAEGYDGQFTYYIAISPDASDVAEMLDVPAYRYQRILLPMLARVLGLGYFSWIPWTLIGVNLAAHFAGTWAVAGLLERRSVSGWYALSYGLWVGLVAPVGIGLSEPLAYGLVALGLLLGERGRDISGPLLIGLATFAKETAIVFLVALMAAELMRRRRAARLLAYGAGLLGLAVWQTWLWITFGAPGLGSGGAMATGFELVPFMGLLRIGQVSTSALALFLLVFGPSIVLPAAWGVIVSARDLMKRAWKPDNWMLLFNGISIMVLPFSTFREPLGLVRFADGLVLAVVLYAARHGLMRPLRYSLFWSVLLVMLISR